MFRSVVSAPASYHYFKGAYPMHSHGSWEIMIVTKGKIRHVMNGTEEVLLPKDMVLISPHDVHEIKTVKDCEAEHLTATMVEELFKELTEYVCKGSYELFSEIKMPTTFHLSDAEYDSFKRIINNCNTIFNKNDAQIRETIAKFMFTLTMQIMLPSVLSEKAQEFPEWLTKFIGLLKDPESFTKNVNELAELSGYCHDHLLRLFKKHTGKTLVDYIAEVKMNYACRLLTTTYHSTLEISGLLGYDSLSHFNRVFKAKIGKTPREYRSSAGNAVVYEE